MDYDAERREAADGRQDQYLLADPGRRIGDVFPALARVADEAIDPLMLDARSVTTLRRLKCATWGDLADKTIGEIWTTPNAGQLTVGRILDAAKARARSASEVEWASAGGASELADGPSGPPPGLIELHRVVVDLASWAVRERRAELLADVIRISDDLGRVPDEIRQRYEYVARYQLADFGATVDASLPASLLDDLLAAIGERVEILVARRIRLHQRPTLQELGEDLGVTRERVRQLEVTVVNAASRELRSDQFAPLRWRASDLREVLGAAVPASSATLRDALDWATRDFSDPDGCTKEELLLWLAGPYKADGGWLVLEGVTLKDLAAKFNVELGESWLVSEDEATEALEATGVPSGVLHAFLAEATRLRQLDNDCWVRWEGSLGSKAEVVLRLIGTPRGVDAINEAIGEGHASSSLRNVLASDSRFVRLDKAGTFGLAEWGLEEYSGIAQEIRERIERRGGEVEVDELVAEFVGKFGVSETSVRMYAASPAFVLNEGFVRLRRDDEPYVADTRIARVRGLYLRQSGEVTVEICVDHDVLRGSGRQFYEAAAIALGVGPGERREFVFTDTTRIVVSWPATAVMGPTLGSVRQAALSLDLSEGETFRLILDPRDGTAHAVAVDPTSLEGLTGLDVAEEDAATVLATAIGVEVKELRAALQARGDDEVLMFLPVVRPTDDLVDAISEFGDLLS